MNPRASEKQILMTNADTSTYTTLIPLDHNTTDVMSSSYRFESDGDIPAASANNDSPRANMDSWSSVVEQPSCPLCQVTFDDDYKLQRHIKYSSLHATSLKKEKEREMELKVTLEEENSGRPPTPQEEGVHYKQLYSGDKYFWRTKVNLEIRLYLHLSSHVVEVAGYDKAHNAPTNRVYLDHNILLSVIKEMAMKNVQRKKREIKERQEEARKKRKEFNEVIPSEEVMLNEAKRVVLVTHILDRLQIDLHNGKNKPALFFLPIVKIADTIVDTELEENKDGDRCPATSDDVKKEEHCESKILLRDPPLELQPIYIPWRRYSSIEECVTARNHLESGMKDLASASEKANKLTELIFSTTSGLGAIAERYRNMRVMGYSKWRIKWIWAIRRVIIQKDVAKNTKRLKELGHDV